LRLIPARQGRLLLLLLVSAGQRGLLLLPSQQLETPLQLLLPLLLQGCP
jgi:hypothetical protein